MKKTRPPANNLSAYSIADRLHSASIHLLRRLRKVDDAIGLTAPKLSALSVIAFSGPLSLGELAAAEQVRPPTITRIVRELEAAGLARSSPDSDDRRILRVSATPKGTRLIQTGRSRRIENLASRIESISPSERKLLERAVSILEALARE